MAPEGQALRHSGIDQVIAEGDTAGDLLLAYDAGVYAYGEPFVRERLLASGLNVE